MKARFCTFIMICLAAIAICLPNSVLKAEAAKSGKCGDNVTYTLGDDGTMTLSGSGVMTDYASSEDVPWYGDRKAIKKVVIEDGITWIDQYSFYSCSNLTQVIIHGDTKISNYAFDNCFALTSVSYRGTVNRIEGTDAFGWCRELNSFTLLEGVGKSGDSFFDCKKLSGNVKLLDASGIDKTEHYTIKLVIDVITRAENFMTVLGNLEKGSIDVISDQYYTGEQIKPAVTVKWNGQTVSAEKYTVAYGANIAEGTGTVTVTGNSDKYYTGTLTQTFRIIEPLDMTGVSAQNVAATYDGNAHGITVTGAPAGATITYSTSEDGTYTAEQPVIKNVSDSGTIYYKVNATNYKEFKGSANVTISPINLAECNVADIAAQNYTGSAVIPEVTVTYGGVTLQKDVDYTATGSSVNQGTGSVTLTGCGNFTGNYVKDFVINPVDATDLTVALSATSVNFTNSIHSPAIVVYWNATQLVEGTDYTVSWNKTPILAADTYVVTISCQGNFTGAVSRDFIVNKAWITNINVAQASVLKYTGNPQRTLVYTSADALYDQPVTFRYSKTGTNDWGDMPMFTEAGQYTVYYEVSAPNHRTEQGHFVVTINEGENVWVSEPTVENWGYGENAKVSLGSAKFGTSSVHYIGTAKDGTPWDSADAPTKVGDYTATFTVPATRNYSGLTLRIPFQIEKGNYDLSNTRWDYEGGFRYNGQEKTVSVINLPAGVTVAGYTGEKGTDIAVYTASVTLNYDSYNYNEPVIEALVWAINRPWDYNPQPSAPNNEVKPTDVATNQGVTPTDSANHTMLSPHTGYRNIPWFGIALMFASAAIVSGIAARKSKK